MPLSKTGVPLTRCSGSWTEARFNSFIKSALRAASQKWKPIQTTKTKARVGKGLYLCSACCLVVPGTMRNEAGVLKNNVVVDHIDPIINPKIGFVSWGEVVDRMFVEEEGLAAVCRSCHDEKTTEERNIATARRRAEK